MSGKWVVILSILCVAAGGPSWASGPSIFEPASKWLDPAGSVPKVEDLFLDPPYTKDWQDRTFFFNGRLDNGTVFVISLFHWQFPVLKSWGLLVAVTDPQGRVFQYEDTLPLSKSQIAKSGFSFKFGETVFEATADGYRVKVALSGFSCDLEIRNILPAWMPGDGWAFFTEKKDAFIHFASPSPWAAVSGSMTVFGQTMSAAGQCSWDSSETVLSLSLPSSPQFILRAFSPADVPAGKRMFVGMSMIYPNEGYGSFSIPMLLVARNGEWVLTSNSFFLAANDWTRYEEPPYPYPSRYSISVKQGQTSFDGTFTSERVYSITDVMQKVPKFIRNSAAAIFKRPVIFRMVGSLKGTLTTAQGQEENVDLYAIAQYAVVK